MRLGRLWTLTSKNAVVPEKISTRISKTEEIMFYSIALGPVNALLLVLVVVNLGTCFLTV